MISYLLLPMLVIAGPQAAGDKSQSRPAQQLAVLMVPSDIVLDALVARFQAEYRSGWSAGEGADLEDRHPGLMTHTMQAGVTAYRSVLDRQLPGLMLELAADVDRSLTPAQITAATQFLRSSTGTKVTGAVFSSLHPGKTVDELESAAKAKISGSIDEADEAALQAFIASGAPSKLTELRAQFRPKIATWAVRVNVEADPLIAAEIEFATAAFLERSAEPKP